MISLNNISKSFGSVDALKGVSVSFPRSKITIIAGADGAGKSTLFRLILGLEKVDSGEIYINDEKIKKDYSKITSLSGFMPERFSLYTDLTVEENLDFFADINNVPFKRRESLKNRLLENTGMINFRNRKAGALSGGMKQKLSLSSILLSSPELIILDEPTTGVDPLSRIEFFRIIEMLKDEGKTILISTPYLDEAENGDHIVFLKDGQIIKRGDITELKKDVPFRLWRILPKENIFELIENLKGKSGPDESFFIKGKYLNFIGRKKSNLLDNISTLEITEQKPALEDIYMYYEKQGNIGENIGYEQ